jgi:DNA-binding response OmpR family regulator
MTNGEITQLQVIYVEDSQLQAELLRAGLSVYGIEVLHLANGDESLIEELSRGHYDDASAIILDINIGELTGLQVARRLRANADSRPIIVISSDEKPPQDELMSIQAIFVSKPFNFEQISETIKRVSSLS